MSAAVPTEQRKKTKTEEKEITTVREHIVEIVSDSGEGAQKAGQSFAAICAKMGNGVWTVEIIPAEIQPPPRVPAGASGIRIRSGSFYVTNAGDSADLVVGFNEQVLLGRVKTGNMKEGCTILLENMWRTHHDPEIVKAYTETYDRLIEQGFVIHEIPMEEECLKYVSNPRRGKNMFVLGMLCSIYNRDLELAKEQVKFTFRKKGENVIQTNIELLQAGYEWADENLELNFEIPSANLDVPQIVTNGNIALGMGIMASGMEVCAMYPITPATSASHYLSEVFENVGGLLHQAEDEIAACAFAIGASFAGKCTVTITSGPGLALKTELLGLAVMAEIPLVFIDVQRGGPSTGLPTKVEQGDLLAAVFGTPGDAPKVVMAPATIEDCFYSVITARKIAEEFRMPVIILSDANLATGQQPFPRPQFDPNWLAPPIDLSPVPVGKKPYDWDEKTGLSRRIIPGQANGMHAVTGLAHDRDSHVAYDPETNQEGCRHRSLKLIALQKTLKPPEVFGDPEGDLLLVGWGSTKGAIEEAVERVRKDGLKVSSLHLKFLQPLPYGINKILQKFKRVTTVEINHSDKLEDDIVDPCNQRYSDLAWLLRVRYLVDVEDWSNVYGQPIKPGAIEKMIREKIAEKKEKKPCLE